MSVTTLARMRPVLVNDIGPSRPAPGRPGYVQFDVDFTDEGERRIQQAADDLGITFDEAFEQILETYLFYNTIPNPHSMFVAMVIYNEIR